MLYLNLLTCCQVTKEEYEASKLTGAETALLELLDALLQDSRMTDKEKKKKLAKFKEAYPAIWRYISQLLILNLSLLVM